METQERKWDSIGDERGPFAHFRLGMVYLVYQPQPTDTKGTIPHPPPQEAKVTKYYLRPLGINLGTREYAKYPVPTGVARAPFGEIFLRRSREAKITFARFGEKKAFGFDGKPYLRLKIGRESVEAFRTLFIKVNRNGVYSYYRLEIQWEGDESAYDYDAIHVFLDSVEESDVPPHLVGGPAR